MDETPWAEVQRLKGEGASMDTIVAALRPELSQEDVELLLQSDADFLAWKRGQPVSRAEPTARAPAAAAPPTDWGRIGRWTVVVISLVASGVTAAVMSGVLGVVAMVVAALPAIALVALEARRGRARALRATGYALFFSYIIPALAAVIGGVNAPRLVGGVLFLLAVPLIVVISKRAPRLRGLVELGLQSVFETSGVQFGVSYAPTPVGLGEHVLVQVYAQNVLDVPRTLVVSVRGEQATGIEAQEHTLALEPGVIVRAEVPVRVPSLSQHETRFIVDFNVTGDGVGRRLTLHHGADWVTPSRASLTNVLGAATFAVGGVGLFYLGSNGVVAVKVDTSKPYVNEPRPLQVETLYAPTQHELEVVLRG